MRRTTQYDDPSRERSGRQGPSTMEIVEVRAQE